MCGSYMLHNGKCFERRHDKLQLGEVAQGGLQSAHDVALHLKFGWAWRGRLLDAGVVEHACLDCVPQLWSQNFNAILEVMRRVQG
eukprot:400283-Amphidinium_carterae.1